MDKDLKKPRIIVEYALTIHGDELEKSIQSVWNASKRRKNFGWKLDRVIVKKIGGISKSRKILCALAGVIYLPDKI